MSTKKLSLRHIIKTPKGQVEKAPCMIMFHGYGSNEEDLFSFAGELPEELFIISARAPYDLMPYGYAWYAIHFDATDGKWSDNEQAARSRDLIAKFIDEVKDAYPIQKDNITLLGFSQGTILSYAVALSYPEKVKNVVALSGYVNQDILQKPEHPTNHLNIYASHGTLDQVIPVDWARRSPSFLEEKGIDHVYEEFPVGHGVEPQNFYSFKRWLEQRL